MRISGIPVKVAMIIGVLFLFYSCTTHNGSEEQLLITYPFNKSVFPADIIAPVVRWQNTIADVEEFKITVLHSGAELVTSKTFVNYWKPKTSEWRSIRKAGDVITVRVEAFKKKVVASAEVDISISEDKVEAPIFFRAVPLPFKFARENLKKVRWHLGSASEESQPHVVLENIPVCANCHSFTPHGESIAMDVDARDDKGAYVITEMNKKISFSEDSIIHWSDFQNGDFTYGLLSQISPDGRYVVSTLKDCEIFSDRKEMEYSQLFFPFKGILVVFDRQEKKYFELKGANDTSLVHSNPCWTPDGQYIYFTRAKAKQFTESGIHHGSVPKAIDTERYQNFEKHYMDRDSLIKFDICKIPFNNGKGGEAVPVEGASNNGMSNYFPKISPDGKWLVFCQAESFMLLQKDSKLNIVPAEGGKARQLISNTSNMNSWHSWSPNGKWLVYATKALSPYTQLFLTHIDENGNDSPPVYLENFSFNNYANNIPEFVDIKYDKSIKIIPSFLSENDFIIRNGEIALANGDLQGAYKFFDEAVRLFPEMSEPWYQRGRIHFERNEFQKSLDDFNRAIQLEQFAYYYTSRGITYLKLNEPQKAAKDLTKAIELDPEYYTPLTYMGIYYYNNKDYRKAKEMLEESLQLYKGDAYTYYFYGLTNYSTNRPDLANDALTKAIQLGPGKSIEPLVFELRANVRYELNDYVGVIKDLQHAIKLIPNDPAMYLLKGKAELKNGMIDEARKSFTYARKFGSREADSYLNQI